MKNFNDNNFKEAMHLYAEKMDKEFPTDEEVADVKFSAEFEQKIDNIVQSRKGLSSIYSILLQKGLLPLQLSSFFLYLSLLVLAQLESLLSKCFRRFSMTTLK